MRSGLRLGQELELDRDWNYDWTEIGIGLGLGQEQGLVWDWGWDWGWDWNWTGQRIRLGQDGVTEAGRLLSGPIWGCAWGLCCCPKCPRVPVSHCPCISVLWCASVPIP